MVEFKAIVTSNPLLNTGQAYSFQAVLGKEVTIKKYDDKYMVVEYENTKHTVIDNNEFYQKIELNFDDGFFHQGKNTLKIGEKIAYKIMTSNSPKNSFIKEHGIGRIVWFNEKLETATVYDIYDNVYRTTKLNYNYCHKITKISSIDDLLNMRSSFGNYKIVDVSKELLGVVYYNEHTEEYKRLIWYADGGLGRFFHSLAKLGFAIEFEPSDKKSINNFEKLFQLAEEHDLDIIQREHMHTWGVINNKDVIKKVYPLREYMLQMFNLEINITEVENNG